MAEDKKEPEKKDEPGFFGKFLRRSTLTKKIKKKKPGEKSIAEQINFGGKFK